ncbi:sensor histidine kinase [Nitriliruptor alkaliphilus]|uniref:sensor histidine kinase n=1 Tax=Nitriliruptor alkaliphilus TaxID=427918 RepID=UPI0006979013|nr:ATP-binding protein [Nitriliruptor alkaliphilus]
MRDAPSSASAPWWSKVVDRLAYGASSLGLERWARLGSVAIVPLFLPDTGTGIAPVYGALTAYVLLTALARRDRFVRGGDLVVAAAIIVATGGQVAPFLLFLAVAVAGPASAGGIRAGAAAGATLSLVLLTVLGLDGQLADLGTWGVIPVALLLPLAGITTASAAQVLDGRIVAGRVKLQEANRLLSALLDIADDLPGGLDATTVAAAVCSEIRAMPGVPAVAVMVEDLGVLHVAASHELHPGRLPALRIDVARRLGDLQLRTPRQLPPELRRACEEQPFWMCTSLGAQDEPVGLLLVAVESAEIGARVRPTLVSLTVDAAIALQNARLFDGTLARAADAARRRLAADLHDGVAQSLAHLKMELELQTVTGGRRSADSELARLARVADTALSDLRSTIAGLRSDPTGDLASLLQQHVAQVTPAAGPSIELEVAGTAELPPDRINDALRVVQEALSNALRHADAGVITIALERDHALTEVVIEDNGVGRAGTSGRAGGGVGLRSMRERADRLQGTLTVRDRLGGGTVVTLRFPTRPSSAPSSPLPRRPRPHSPATSEIP